MPSHTYQHSDFRVEDFVGFGAFANCEAVLHLPSNTRMCRKALTISAKHESLPYLHERELKALRTLCHPYIVTYFGYYRFEDQIYILTELCDKTLKTFLDDHPRGLPLNLTLKFLAQILCAVSYLHEKNFLHRDLKPENIVIDTNQNLKLIDFGTSRQYDSSMTAMQGSPMFMSTEILCRKSEYFRSVDYFAAGLIGYVMATGSLPFNSAYETLRNEPNWNTVKDLNLKSLLQAMLDKNYKTTLNEKDFTRTLFVDRRAQRCNIEFQKKWFRALLKQHCELKQESADLLCVNDFSSLPTGRSGVAVHRSLGKVFVKKLDGDSPESMSVYDSRTFDILNRFKHDNLVPFYGYFPHNGAIYVVTKYCEYDLRQYCYHSVGINPFEIIIPLLNCIRYLHRCGVILRNLSPEKIRVSADGIVYLVSFSGARTQVSANNFSLTQSAPSSHDTSPYCAPELSYADLPYFFEVDFYSLGVVVFELLLGRLPSSDNRELMAQLSRCQDVNLRILLFNFLEQIPIQRRQTVVDLLNTRLFMSLSEEYS
ncbi:hypothetical protein RCL1_002877 [Eukaryota sp. TZLM3-RCL]